MYEATISDVLAGMFAHDMQYVCNFDEDRHAMQSSKAVTAKYLNAQWAGIYDGEERSWETTPIKQMSAS